MIAWSFALVAHLVDGINVFVAWTIEPLAVIDQITNI